MSEVAFLAAVRAEPTDDAVRLVYADWLQECGEDGRAELIRVQVALAHPLPARPSSMSYSLVSSEAHVRQVLEYRAAVARRAVLELRERELLSSVRLPLPAGWAVGSGLGLTVRGARGDLHLRRGLGERAVCSGAAWVADGDAILAAHPVERVRLTSPPSVRADANGVELAGDPSRRLFGRSEVAAARRPSDPFGEATAALRLRYGGRVTFEWRDAIG